MNPWGKLRDGERREAGVDPSSGDRDETATRGHNTVVRAQKDPAKAWRARELRRSPTPEEDTLWQAVRANRLFGLHFRRQQVIDGFIVDLYCHAAGLVVELDGHGHERQAGYDAERERILAARGLRILRTTNDEVTDHLARVLKRIAKEALGQAELRRAARGAAPE